MPPLFFPLGIDGYQERKLDRLWIDCRVAIQWEPAPATHNDPAIGKSHGCQGLFAAKIGVAGKRSFFQCPSRIMRGNQEVGCLVFL